MNPNRKLVTFRRISPYAEIPKMATLGAACYDVSAYLKDQEITGYSVSNEVITSTTESFIVIKPGERWLIPTGWAVKIPSDYSMRIYSRSGLALKQGLVVHNGVGIIDSDYRNQVYVVMANHSSRWVKVTHGDRIAQMDFQKVLDTSLDFDIIHTSDDEWFENNGRSGGFGSTGVSSK